MKYNIILISTLLCISISCESNFKQKVKQSVINQLELYPKSTLIDIYKNFYQDRFGTGHAITDTTAAKNYLKTELVNMQIIDTKPMIEKLGWENNFIRVNIELVLENIITIDNLFDAFVESSEKVNPRQIKDWPNEWKKIISIIETMRLSMDNFEQDKQMIFQMLKENPNFVPHHSQIFRKTYHPHYRIIERSVFEKRLAKYF